jgi:hypothetical protein
MVDMTFHLLAFDKKRGGFLGTIKGLLRACFLGNL